MKRIIDGKTYNTETATCICELDNRYHKRDFSFHETKLYLSPKGQYFLAGAGGPSSMWAESVGQNDRIGGEGLKLIEKDEARQHAEKANLSEDEMVAAGFEVTEG